MTIIAIADEKGDRNKRTKLEISDCRFNCRLVNARLSDPRLVILGLLPALALNSLAFLTGFIILETAVEHGFCGKSECERQGTARR
ncbi:hypothetical protein BMR06_05395 [Methylococcaceae bacterium HT5]|nr:hypothetical protein BMR06_05395 [Methylococcaceae bacterium HT5]